MILHWYHRTDIEGPDPWANQAEIEEEKWATVDRTTLWLRWMHEELGWPTILCHSHYDDLTIIKAEDT